MSAILHQHKYLPDQSLAASFVGSAIDCRMLEHRRVTFTANWGAVGATDGDWYVEVSDDPRVEMDKARGTTTALWNKRTIPPGSIDGTQITVVGQAITINANAGSFSLNLKDVSGFIRLGYTRRGGGGAAQAQVYASGN
jgi:hypothetical protein